jgi:putative ATPase
MNRNIPLAEQLRARSLKDIVGQEHILAKDALIPKIIASKRPLSLLLWGPPGVGKTSIARLYAQAFSLNFVNLSAVNSGTSDIKKIIKESENNPLFCGTTLLFMDEIHRFNKSQQDAFLPYIENGTIILVGATTENPSFYLNNALLSRLRVLTLKPLDDDALEALILRYEKSFGDLVLDVNGRQYLKEAAQGDGRYLFNMIENIGVVASKTPIDIDALKLILQKQAASYDRAGDCHYNLISALHKSIRSSDPDAALYWFARMIKGGEDPLFIARRLIRMASEDIGLADPNALSLAIAARDSYTMLGSPEGELSLAQIVVYLSLAPKSNAVYMAYKQACEVAERTSHISPPKHILNAPTKLMKDLDYSKDYIYDHDTALGCSGANNFPDEIARSEFYQPVERGFERDMKKRLEYFNVFRQKFLKK